jgi:hypothetical protein
MILTGRQAPDFLATETASVAHVEGTLFPWTMSEFSLMDAIECGIVKLPRVPVAENIPGDEMPIYRNLWENSHCPPPKNRDFFVNLVIAQTFTDRVHRLTE